MDAALLCESYFSHFLIAFSSQALVGETFFSRVAPNLLHNITFFVCLFVTEEIPITVLRRAPDKEAWSSQGLFRGLSYR